MNKLSPREGQKATLRESGSDMEAEAMSSQAGGLLQPNADLCLLQHGAVGLCLEAMGIRVVHFFSHLTSLV